MNGHGGDIIKGPQMLGAAFSDENVSALKGHFDVGFKPFFTSRKLGVCLTATGNCQNPMPGSTTKPRISTMQRSHDVHIR